MRGSENGFSLYKSMDAERNPAENVQIRVVLPQEQVMFPETEPAIEKELDTEETPATEKDLGEDIPGSAIWSYWEWWSFV